MGDLKITKKLTGRYGGRLRVGRVILPRHVFVDFTGNEGHPDLRMHLEWRDGRPQVVELTITSKTDGRGIRTSDLEALALDGIARSIFEGEATIVLEDRADGTTLSAMPDWSDPRFERERWEIDSEINDAIATRRGTLTQAQLERVAEIHAQHKGKGALLAISSALGVSERTAARRVNDARAAGLLPDSDRKASR